MGTVRSLYTNSQPVTFAGGSPTVPLLGLADGSTAVSDIIDNSTTRFITADFQLKFTTTSGTSAIGSVGMFIVRSVDGGTTVDDAPLNAEAIANFAANVSSTTFRASTDSALSGQLPDFFRIAVKNMSGAALSSSAGSCSITFLGKQFELV